MFSLCDKIWVGIVLTFPTLSPLKMFISFREVDWNNKVLYFSNMNITTGSYFTRPALYGLKSPFSFSLIQTEKVTYIHYMSPKFFVTNWYEISSDINGNVLSTTFSVEDINSWICTISCKIWGYKIINYSGKNLQEKMGKMKLFITCFRV